MPSATNAMQLSQDHSGLGPDWVICTCTECRGLEHPNVVHRRTAARHKQRDAQTRAASTRSCSPVPRDQSRLSTSRHLRGSGELPEDRTNDATTRVDSTVPVPSSPSFDHRFSPYSPLYFPPSTPSVSPMPRPYYARTPSPMELDRVDEPTGLENHRLDGRATATPEDDEFEEGTPERRPDPLFRTREELLDDFPDDYSDGGSSDHSSDDVPPAFEEHPQIRSAYIHAFISSAFEGCTQDHCANLLEQSYHQLLASCEASPETTQDLQESLPYMARTLRSAERRLGVDPDQHIIYEALCPECWKVYTFAQMNALPGPQCTANGCEGILYAPRRLEHGRIRNVPAKIFSRTDLEDQLRQILSRPGKYDELQHWRRPGDEPAGGVAPLGMPRNEYDAFSDHASPLFDITDGCFWCSGRADLVREEVGPYRVEDRDANHRNQRFVSLPCGIYLSVSPMRHLPISNVGLVCRFRGTKKGKHSTGAMYATLLNNPRAKRFLREETILVCMIPGPAEPSLEQLNAVMDPFINDVHRLYNGFFFKAYYQNREFTREIAHTMLLLNISDLLANRKSSGCVSHSSKEFMCTDCWTSIPELAGPEGSDSNRFELRDPWNVVKYAYVSRGKTEAEREDIATRRGARWSPFMSLPGWLPAINCPTDFMHTTYLGEVDHVLHHLIGRGALLSQVAANHYPAQRFKDFLKQVWWPASSGRVPHKIASSGSATADQLRNLAAVLPVALYAAWQVNGEILDREPPRPAPRTKALEALKAHEKAQHARQRELHARQCDLPMNEVPELPLKPLVRNHHQFYNALLEWATAIRIWSSRSITPEEVKRAQDAHDAACRAWIRMGYHLTQVFHYSCHNDKRLLRFGPVYAWWTYAGERNNGFLGNIKHNNHAGGELEATMIRRWIKASLVWKLISHLESLGPHQSNEDRRQITKLRAWIKGHKKDARNRGTLLSLVASMAARDAGEDLAFPDKRRQESLIALGLYGMVFNFLRTHWRHNVQLVNQNSARRGTEEAFLDVGTVSYSNILVHGLRYGAGTHFQGRNSRYAYINGRNAVEIQYILHVKHMRRDERLPPLEAVLVIVAPFVNDNVPEMPWGFREVDLGIDTWHAHRLGERFVLDARALCGQFALAEVEHPTQRLWVTMSLCRDAQEPDELEDE